MMKLYAGVFSILLMCSAVACSTGQNQFEKQKKAEFHYKLANNHFYDEQIVSALKELTACLKHSPEHPDAHHLMGFIFLGRKDYSRAERHLQKALKSRPGFHEARANLGVVMLHSRRYQEAVEVLTPLIDATLYATPWLLHNNIGFAYHQLGKSSKALKHYRQAIFHNPKFCLGYNNLGRLYKELNQRDLAVDYLTRAITRCDKYPEPHFHLGTIYQSEARYRDAQKSFSTCFKLAPESPYGRRCRVRM